MKILFYSLLTITFLCSSLSAQIDTTKKNEIRLSLYSNYSIKPFLGEEVNYLSNNTAVYNATYLRKLKSDKYWLSVTMGGRTEDPRLYVFNVDNGKRSYVDAHHAYFYTSIGVESQHNFKYFAIFPSLGLYFDRYAFNGNLDYLENPANDFKLNETNVGVNGSFTMVTNLSETFYLFIRASAHLTYENSYRSHGQDGSPLLFGNGWGMNYNMRLLEAIGISKRF